MGEVRFYIGDPTYVEILKINDMKEEVDVFALYLSSVQVATCIKRNYRTVIFF